MDHDSMVFGDCSSATHELIYRPCVKATTMQTLSVTRITGKIDHANQDYSTLLYRLVTEQVVCQPRIELGGFSPRLEVVAKCIIDSARGTRTRERGLGS